MNTRITGGLFVFLGACSFGLLSTIVKFAYDAGYSLGEVTGAQSFVGMLVLWLAYYAYKLISLKTQLVTQTSPTEKQTDTPIITSTPLWKVCVAGSFTGLVGIFYYQCVKILPASIAIILLMQYLWITVLIESIVYKKRPSLKQILLVVFVLAGTLLAGGYFSESVHITFSGLVYGFLAALSYAIFIITSGRIGNDLPVLKKSALMITGSCIITFLLFPPLYLFNGVFWSGLYLWGFALALLGTVVPPFLFSVGMPQVGISIGAILSAAELPVATLSSALILKESVDNIRWLGVVVILLAILLANINNKEEAAG